MRFLRYLTADLLGVVADIAQRIDARYADALNPKDER